MVFSCRGIKICVDWFRGRGHKEITVFVPLWRKESSRPDNPITGTVTTMNPILQFLILFSIIKVKVKLNLTTLFGFTS